MPTMLWKLAAGGLLFAAAPVLAQSPFDGTWKAQVSSIKSTSKPETFSLKSGRYSCQTCIPAFAVPADGKFHAVKGKDYWDELAVTTVDDRTVRFEFKKAGKVISTNTETVSADGAMLATKSMNTNNGGAVPIETTGSGTRVGQPVAGAHAISGNWQFAPPTAVSDAAMTMTLKVDGDKLTLTSAMGETLRATIGGAYAPNEGDPGKTMTKVERAGPRALKMTDMRAGKVTSVATYTVSEDGATLTGVAANPQTGSKSEFTATKI